MRKKLFRRIAVLFAAALVCLAGCEQPGGPETEEPAQHTIAFESHGGSEVEAITADEGTEVEEPAEPAREGYRFTGWFSSEEGGTEYDWPHTLAADVTMHARWLENTVPPPAQYTITFDSHGGSAVAAVTAEEGTALEQPGDPARENHAFAGWYSAETEGTLYEWPHTLTGDVTMHAHWQENAKYTLTFDSHGGSEVQPILAYAGTAAEQPPDPAREGYAFTGWYSAETEGTLCSWPHVLAGNTTMHAHWRENTLPPPERYTVTFDSHGGSEVAAITADEGTALEQPGDPARANYNFAGWYSAETGGTLYDWPHTLSADVTMHARWQAKARHTLSFDSHGGSAVQPVTDYEGTAVEKPGDPARANHTFNGWYSAETGGALYSWPHVLTGNTTMHAQWRENPRYILIFNSHGGSAVQPVTAYTGTAVPRPANPARENYAFAGWFSAAEGGTEYEWPHTLNADLTMHARWQENARYTITFDSHGGSTVPPVTVYTGATVPKPADPVRANYSFTGWFSSAESGTKYSWPYAPAADLTMHAQWRDTVKSITGVPTGGVVGVELDLSGARVSPATAPQTIVWRVKDAGNSGVTAVTDGKFTALKAENQLKLTAVVAGGGANNGDYTEDFIIKIVKPGDFIGVDSIYNVPASGVAGSPLTLTGVVQPASATNTTIVWSVADPGTTGAALEGVTLKAQSPGTVIVKAVIEEGLTGGIDFEREFYITIIVNESLPAIPGPGFYTFSGTWDPDTSPPDLRFAEGFEYPENPDDFLDEALKWVEADGNYLIVLDRDYVLGPQYLDIAGAQVALLGWEKERILESSERSSPLFLVENGTLILGANIRVINSPGAGTVRRIQLEGGDLLMYEGAFIGIEEQVSNGGAVEVGNGSSFAMHGGGIVNCAATNGGAVNVLSGGTFTLAGGSITGNEASGAGGGVYNNGGTFTVSGGSITGNTKGDNTELAVSNISGDIPDFTGSATGADTIYRWGEALEIAVAVHIDKQLGGLTFRSVLDMVYADDGNLLQKVTCTVSGVGDFSSDVVWTIEGGLPGTTLDADTGMLTVDPNETANQLTVRATSTSAEDLSGTAVMNFYPMKDLAVKFGITEKHSGTGNYDDIQKPTITTKEDVTNVFNAVSAYIKDNAAFGTANSLIQLGDYIDLPALTVAYYQTSGAGGGGFSSTNTWLSYATNRNVNFNGWSRGYTLRLVVAGINTFNSLNGNNEPHVVFHFRSVVGPRRMNSSNTNTSGYAGSEMRKYLTDIADDANSGKFLAGLVAAGVPSNVIWAPTRTVSASNSTVTTVTDKVWLPTMWELTGASNGTNAAEDGTNQVQFPLYNPNQYPSITFMSPQDGNVYTHSWFDRGIASASLGSVWWTGSPTAGNAASFRSFSSASTPNDSVNGFPSNSNAALTTVYISPAFCIKAP
jgi:uncharacterized repeat protein (TIGR02543 family)